MLSDGRWTGRDVSAAAARAAAAGVAIDYRAIERSAAGDLAIERIEGPESVLPGESFMITAWIDSPLGQTVSYELLRGSQVIARGTQTVPSGTSRLALPRHGRRRRRLRVHAARRRARAGPRARRTTARGCWWAFAARGRCCA